MTASETATSATTCTWWHGLRIQSDLPLPRPRPAPGPHRPDLRIRLGESRAVGPDLPAGRVVVDPGGATPFYRAVTREDGSHLLRFHGRCDADVTPDLGEVTLHPTPGLDPDLLGVLLAGTTLAFVLALRGRPALHASAVEVADRAIAFVGGSNMGKSTMAALMCADGARLVSDDVLCLDATGGGAPRCHPGPTEIRLRRSAEDVAAGFADPPGTRITGDDRLALHVPASRATTVTLAALVVPLPDHEAQDLETRRLAPSEALIGLARFPRVLGWKDPAVHERQFHHLADVVARVPVHVARLPWGPPFARDLPARLVASLELDRPGEPAPTVTPA